MGGEVDNPVVKMDVRHLGRGVAVIDIAGDVTGACEGVLMAAHEKVSAEGDRNIVLNFDHLQYMNSGGIGMLVTLLVRAKRQQQQLSAVGLSDHYKEILGLTRLDEAITIFDTEDAAVASATGMADGKPR